KARTLNAEARRAELLAEGEGQKAVLLGEAEGKRQLAEALNAYNQAALQLSVYPELIQKLPEIAEALAAPFAQIDRIVMIDGGGGGNGTAGGPLGKYGSTVPLLLAQAIETLRAVGLDIPGMLGQTDGGGMHSPPAAPGEGVTDSAALARIEEAATAADSPQAPAVRPKSAPPAAEPKE
ncbi:MAG: flotillin domain-containing protein, partial [Dehalococcoidia bacterium]